MNYKGYEIDLYTKEIDLMRNMMESLNSSLSFVNGKRFYKIFTISISLNPIALWLQAYRAWTAVDISGISPTTFSTLCFIQVIGILYGIRIREPAILIAIIGGLTATLTVLGAIMFR